MSRQFSGFVSNNPNKNNLYSLINYYTTPNLDGSSSGTFFVNLNFPHRIQDVLPLAYHEGYPGHHFQITIEVENENIPTIRKMFKLIGYDEGWALYAERLAGTYGFLKEPIDKIGYLNSELYRAVRLVVDTGIHYKKWSNLDAATYMNQFRWYDTYSEMDRYILWPGKACAYKVGKLKILEGEVNKYIESKNKDWVYILEELQKTSRKGVFCFTWV